MAGAGDRSRLGIKLGLRIIRKIRKNLTYVFVKKGSLLTPLMVKMTVIVSVRNH